MLLFVRYGLFWVRSECMMFRSVAKGAFWLGRGRGRSGKKQMRLGFADSFGIDSETAELVSMNSFMTMA